MTDHTSATFRNYDTAGTDKWRATPLKFRKSKTDFSTVTGFEHPDDALNREYLAAGAADDQRRPLCWAVHDGIACRRPVTWKKGARYCWEGRGG